MLDNRRAPCAVGLIAAARRMRELPPGAGLEIWSRDRFAPVEIPVWAAREGYRVDGPRREGRWPRHYLVFEVRRPADAA